MEKSAIKALYNEIINGISSFGAINFPESIKIDNFLERDSYTLDDGLDSDSLDVYKFLNKSALALKDNEEVIFYKDTFWDCVLFLISNKHIIYISGKRAKFMNNQCNLLFEINFDNPSEIFFMMNSHVFYMNKVKNEKQGELSLLCNQNDTKLLVKGKLLRLKDSSLNFTSIEFKDSTLIATFKNAFYSKIIFDYDFNIKEIEISKSLKTKLNISSNTNLTNISCYEDLINEMNKLLDPEILDLYNLVNDTQFKFKDNKNKFIRDIAYIKELVAHKESLFNFHNKNIHDIQNLFNYYKKGLLPINESKNDIKHLEKYGLENSNLSKYLSVYDDRQLYTYYKKLLLLTVMKNYNVKLVNDDLISKLSTINDFNPFYFHVEAAKIKK